MKSFKKLFESIESQNLAIQIAKDIDQRTNTVPRDTSGFKQCHMAVQKVKREGKTWSVKLSSGVDFSYYKGLRFAEWDESTWDHWEWYATVDTSWKSINIPAFKNLITDIADGSVNGHSFIRYREFYIDPYFSSAGIDFNNIQKIGKWFHRAFLENGIPVP